MRPRTRHPIFLFLFCGLLFGSPEAFAVSGPILNPITDILWQETFPIKIAGIRVFASNTYDSPDPATAPLCACPAPPPLFVRVGIPISFWEPARFAEQVKTPYYFPSLGIELPLASHIDGYDAGTAAGPISPGGTVQSEHFFGHVHYFIFPIWGMMEVLTDLVCLEPGSSLDLAYLSELDPLWNDDMLSMVIHPESLLFANPISIMACVADAVSVNAKHPIDPLFWCVGSGGTAYPMTGHVPDSQLVQASTTAMSRMIYKLSRQLLICDTAIDLCYCAPSPIWRKSSYKFHAARPRVEARAWPIGKASAFRGPINPPMFTGKGPNDEFLYMIFRKHACCAW